MVGARLGGVLQPGAGDVLGELPEVPPRLDVKTPRGVGAKELKVL